MESSVIKSQVAFYKKFFESLSNIDFKTITREDILEMLAIFEQAIQESK